MDTLISNNLLGSLSGSYFQLFIRNMSTKSLGITTKYMLRAVVWLVNIVNCFAYDRTVNDEWKVIRPDPKHDVTMSLDGSVSPW